MSSAQARFDATISRMDALLDERVRREQAQLERDAAADRVQARVQARADAERCREYGVRYADAFSAFNVEVPPPIDGELPGRYRRRLFDRLVRKLPSSHDLAEIRADGFNRRSSTISSLPFCRRRRRKACGQAQRTCPRRAN
jgi:hypothetical protein